MWHATIIVMLLDMSSERSGYVDYAQALVSKPVLRREVQLTGSSGYCADPHSRGSDRVVEKDSQSKAEASDALELPG